MHVKIYKPSSSPMQSGRLKNRWWVIEFKQEFTHKESLMHWNSTDTPRHLYLRFSDLQQETQYAQQQGFSYTIISPHKFATPRIRPYSSNFTAKK